MTFFLVPETAYRLPDGLITDFDSAAEKLALSDLSSDKADHVSEEQNRSLVANGESVQLKYLQRLPTCKHSLFKGYYSTREFFAYVIRAH